MEKVLNGERARFAAKLDKVKIFVSSALLVFFGAAIICSPERYIGLCFEGLCLWAECVLPSLFPFMVITLLLIRMGAADAAAKPFSRLMKGFGLPECGAPLFIMSACCGYPAGSRLVCEYFERGYISSPECKRLAPLCSVCGPLFALGTVGVKAFGGGYAGVKLFLSCLLSVAASSLIYCLATKNKTAEPKRINRTRGEDALSACFVNAVSSCLTAGAFICFFYTLSHALCDFGVLKPIELILSPLFGRETAAALAKGLTEATGGCFALAKVNGFFSLPLTGFLLTFGGACILLQQLAYLEKCGVKAGFFIFFKFIQGIICFALLCLLNI